MSHRLSDDWYRHCKDKSLAGRARPEGVAHEAAPEGCGQQEHGENVTDLRDVDAGSKPVAAQWGRLVRDCIQHSLNVMAGGIVVRNHQVQQTRDAVHVTLPTDRQRAASLPRAMPRTFQCKNVAFERCDVKKGWVELGELVDRGKRLGNSNPKKVHEGDGVPMWPLVDNIAV